MHAQPTIQIKKIPSGYQGTMKTVEHVCDLIKNGAKDFTVRRAAIDILVRREVKPKDYLGEIKALFEWVQQNIRYTKDTFRVEVLHSAKRMLELRAGDCDDMTILLGAMLETIGHPVRLVLSGSDPMRQDLFSHIFLEVFHKGQWIPLDATMPYTMGWSSQAPVKKIIAIERNNTMQPETMDLNGLGEMGQVPDWLKQLLKSIKHEAVKPQDPRIKSLWELLRQQQVLGRSRWLKAALRRIWRKGLAARPHPRLAARIVRRLRHWGVLPPKANSARTQVTATGMRPVSPVNLKPVASVRPVSMQSVRPVEVQPAAMRAQTK